MSNARESCNTLKRSDTDTDVLRTFADIDPAVWTLGGTQFGGMLSPCRETTAFPDDSAPDTGNEYPSPPPLTLRPPNNIPDLGVCPVINERPGTQVRVSIRNRWSMLRSKGMAEPGLMQVQAEMHRGRSIAEALNDPEEFIREKNSTDQAIEHKFDAQYLMSGALPNESIEGLPERLFTLSGNTQGPSSAVRTAFDMAMRADPSQELCHPDLFETSEDVFSHQGMYELSRCSSRSERQLESASHLFGHRRDPVTIDAVISQQASTRSNDEVQAGRSMSDSINEVAAALPTELLQEIYWRLGPTDFNAARHCCHNWMAAILQHQLLIEHLKRGGWWATASTKPAMFQEWRRCCPMSCYLARECALAGNWTGRGLRADCADYADTSSPLISSGSVDFKELQETTGPHADLECGNFICTTGSCGTYFLTAVGPSIFMYEIEGQSIRLISRTSCGRQVEAVSVDASSKQFAVAALLEGRIGLYIDVLGKSKPSPVASPWESAASIRNLNEHAPIMDLTTRDGTGSSDVTWSIPVGDFDELSFSAASTGSRTILRQSVEILTQHTWSEYFHGRRAHLRGMRQMPASLNSFWPSTLNFDEMGKGGKRKKVNTEPCSQIVYRNICTEEDSPCSVALSPSRQ